MQDVPRRQYFYDYYTAFLILAGSMVIFVIMMMNRQMSGGGSNAKMMNFGKSRARMTHGSATRRSTFNNVAGLQEEKEDLVEVVDFLKASSEIYKSRCQDPERCASCRPSGNR